jgi:hypothetical protein
MTTSHPKTRLWTTSETSCVSNIRSTIDDIQYSSSEHHLLLSAESEFTDDEFQPLKLAENTSNSFHRNVNFLQVQRLIMRDRIYTWLQTFTGLLDPGDDTEQQDWQNNMPEIHRLFQSSRLQWVPTATTNNTKRTGVDPKTFNTAKSLSEPTIRQRLQRVISVSHPDNLSP